MPPTSDELYKAYEEYSKTLRTWFVAYGVGAPVLFLTNDQVAAKIAKSGDARQIATLFLVGVGLQIILAMVNKTSMWGCYYGEQNPKFKTTYRWKLADWVSEQFWFDFIIDLVTLILFSAGTWCAFQILVGEQPGR